MSVIRPDLSEVDPAVRAYIEALEIELERLRQDAQSQDREETTASEEPGEPPTTVNVITLSAAGMVKRTPRHHYSRQRRGGMGVFDLECADGDEPAFLIVADESHRLIFITDRGRVFVLPVQELPETPVRSRGTSITQWLPLQPDERVAVAVPEHDGSQLHVLSRRGWVRRFSSNIFAGLRPGIMLYEVREGDVPTAACWTSGRDDLFITTRGGKAIRFSERQVPVKGGCLGIRLDRDDQAVAIVAVQPDSGVFLLGNDGRGTVRLMSGFQANKAPGAGGKIAMKTERLVGAVAVSESDDIFAISRLSKIVRFAAAEVPPKEGVVQGVSCMSLRGDETTALAGSSVRGLVPQHMKC